ncbi:hypothetical protein D9M68_778280 [compost metagenome]
MRAVWPGFPAAIVGTAGQQAAVGGRDQAGLELQALIQVYFNPGQQRFAIRQVGTDVIPPAGRKGFGKAGKQVWFFHWNAYRARTLPYEATGSPPGGAGNVSLPYNTTSSRPEGVV